MNGSGAASSSAGADVGVAAGLGADALVVGRAAAALDLVGADDLRRRRTSRSHGSRAARSVAQTRLDAGGGRPAAPRAPGCGRRGSPAPRRARAPRPRGARRCRHARSRTSSAPSGPSRTVQPAPASSSRSRSASAQSLRRARRLAALEQLVLLGAPASLAGLGEVLEPEHVEHLDEVGAPDRLVAAVGLADPLEERAERPRGVEVLGERGEERVAVRAHVGRRRAVDEPARRVADAGDARARPRRGARRRRPSAGGSARWRRA